MASYGQLVSCTTNVAIPLTKKYFKIGRTPDCDIVSLTEGVSRLHAELTVDHANKVLLINKSRNGTEVNDIPVVNPVELKNNDVITIIEDKYKFEEAPDTERPQEDSFTGFANLFSPRRLARLAGTLRSTTTRVSARNPSSASEQPDDVDRLTPAIPSKIVETMNSGRLSASLPVRPAQPTNSANARSAFVPIKRNLNKSDHQVDESEACNPNASMLTNFSDGGIANVDMNNSIMSYMSVDDPDYVPNTPRTEIDDLRALNGLVDERQLYPNMKAVTVEGAVFRRRTPTPPTQANQIGTEFQAAAAQQDGRRSAGQGRISPALSHSSSLKSARSKASSAKSARSSRSTKSRSLSWIPNLILVLVMLVCFLVVAVMVADHLGHGKLMYDTYIATKSKSVNFVSSAYSQYVKPFTAEAVARAQKLYNTYVNGK